MKKIGTKNLTYTQRLQIETLYNKKFKVKDIAEVVGVNSRTVYYELKRGLYNRLDGFTWKYFKSYSAQIAHDKYKLNCTKKGRPLKIGNDFEFVKYVEDKCVKEKLSACAVLGQIHRQNLPFATKISKTTLYRYIEIGLFSRIRLEKRKQQYRKQVMKRAPKGTSIERRPSEINNRNTFGHWEMDCVCGKGRSTLLVLSERLTRFEIIFKMNNQKSESVIHCLDNLERLYKHNFVKIFKSITMDNGSEFSNHVGIEKSIYGGKRTSTYYCHPYCSCERGTNERLNREIRRIIPKGSDLSRYSNEDIQEVAKWVNNYPREVLGFATSKELFDEQMKLIA